ncbi:response regulator [Breoghania sp. L-A4]|uniref:response regulator n=1 Tax=Breoghania sp. L-A4 TaxID=2304600 RepID=UPI000E35FF0E|nr:response regulator [Breoghania sp. L-A4]AXS41711.1 response regulator [Breoghania sp. L-A4]
MSIVTTNADVNDPIVAGELELPPGNYVSIAVTDNGEGMSKDVVAHAFEPFYTTKDVGAGTGLGLSMVYGFALQSGGGVSLSSVAGEGTTVVLYLPKLDDDALIDSDNVPIRHVAAGAEDILVVEDDADMRRIAAESLERLGYRVTVAADGPEAIAILEQGAEFDLLLTDIRLPNGMPGADVARRARTLSPTLSVVFMTGYAETARVGAAELGEDAILLRKPFRRIELARALNRALLRDAEARDGV